MQEPVNHRYLDPAAVPAAVERALMLIKDQLGVLERLGLQPEGLSVLEIGPGSNFGPALMLASMGAKVTLVDRFLGRWQDQYHRPLYEQLAKLWTGPTSQLEVALEKGHEGALRLIASPAETLGEVADETIDLVYSWGVLEHIVNVEDVARETGRTLKPGGHSAHFIDWSCHKDDYSQQLQHLLWRDKEFHVYAEDASWEFGNRYRPSEFEAAFEAAGLALIGREITLRNPAGYVAETISRLRESPSPYRNWPADELDAWAGWMFARKVQEGRDLVMARGANTLALMHAFKAASKTLGEEALYRAVQAYPNRLVLDITQIDARSDGFMWLAAAPPSWPSDVSEDHTRSTALLLEDGVPLGPFHSLHDNIRKVGHGRYSHWDGTIFFSTSDNSSPRENGRRYELVMP